MYDSLINNAKGIKMIEVIEQTTKAGTNATVVGGKRTVTIEARPSSYRPARRSACDGRKIKASVSPAGFWVHHGHGIYKSTFVTDYNRAVSLAVYHAQRK